MRWQLVDLGQINFHQFLRVQDDLWEARVADRIPDTVIFAEHPPTISLGARDPDEQLRYLRVPHEEIDRRDIPVIQTRRGGSITLHAPGILGCYVIQKNPTGLVPRLEEHAQRLFASFGLSTDSLPYPTPPGKEEYRGVWTARGKIASVGIGIASHVSRFGINMNIALEPALLALLHPCGIKDKTMTSLASEYIEATVSEARMRFCRLWQT